MGFEKAAIHWLNYQYLSYREETLYTYQTSRGLTSLKADNLILDTVK